MTRTQAQRLARTIDQTPGCVVTGLRHYMDTDAYGVDVQDTATGIPFVVGSVESWQERRRETEFWSKHEIN